MIELLHWWHSSYGTGLFRWDFTLSASLGVRLHMNSYPEELTLDDRYLIDFFCCNCSGVSTSTIRNDISSSSRLSKFLPSHC